MFLEDQPNADADADGPLDLQPQSLCVISHDP